jgi:hypothetical protein
MYLDYFSITDRWQFAVSADELYRLGADAADLR